MQNGSNLPHRLVGTSIPSVLLKATSGSDIDLSTRTGCTYYSTFCLTKT